MMAAPVHEQIDAKVHQAIHRTGEAPGDAGRRAFLLHPDALLHHQVANGKTPYWNTAVELERFDVDEASWVDGPAAPAIGKKRPGRVAVMQGRVRLCKQQSSLS